VAKLAKISPVKQFCFSFMITFASCFVIGKAAGCGTSQNAGPDFGYLLVVGPLFSECPPPWGFSLH